VLTSRITGLPSVHPVWRLDTDVVVVGSGAAGISTALTAAAAGLRVLVVTKDLVGGATPLAQGGLAAALGPGDTAAAHVTDTLVAGAGLCEPEAVAALADSAPGAIDWLTRLGAELETSDLRLEGGHSKHRIVHSGDDATGAEVHRALLGALLTSRIEIMDRTIALDLVPRAVNEGDDGAGIGTGWPAMDGMAAANAGPAGSPAQAPVPAPAVPSYAAEGLTAALIGPDGLLTPGVISARAVVIAAGGLGQAFVTTSNPAGATGDGIAIAARAGAVLRDLEFVQFHPTVLWLPGASGQCPLITEALRGAGAVLRDLDGTPLMAGHDPRGDLAPRDVVAARMAAVIAAGSAGHVWLDATALGRETLEAGFPTVTAACRKHGIDPVTDFIPVAPGAHYSCGGILASLDGRTTIPGLYAVGEAASTGVQGANRLASNSVTEAIIAGRRTGEALAESLRVRASASQTKDTAWAEGAGRSHPRSGTAAAYGTRSPDDGSAEAYGPAVADRRAELALAMSRWAGVMRDAEGLAELVREIAETGAPRAPQDAASWVSTAHGAGTGAEQAAHVQAPLDLENVEAANLRMVSALIAAGALRRAESRGCHRRRDAAETAGRPWHTLTRVHGDQLLVTEEEL